MYFPRIVLYTIEILINKFFYIIVLLELLSHNIKKFMTFYIPRYLATENNFLSIIVLSNIFSTVN